MIVSPIKTKKVHSGDDLEAVLPTATPWLEENSILVITSKIISLCQNRVVPFDKASKEELIAQESELHLPKSSNKYGHKFTITNNTLIASAGIDESNGDGGYILWPKDPQSDARQIQQFIAQEAGLKNVGVIITDSTCQPLRRGTTGICMAYAGFSGLNNYVGRPDLFDRPFTVSQAGIASGLAAAAVVVMGEGAEQTPLAVISDLPQVKFSKEYPTKSELKEVMIDLEDDLFVPFFRAVNWQKGDQAK